MTRVVNIGKVAIGGNFPVAIQSMTNTHTRNVEETLKQISELADAGCDIVRVAVLDNRDAQVLRAIKDGSTLPLVADIHFNYELALNAIENGADKIRINPGNIGGEDKLNKIIDCAKLHNVAIRIGANGGSINSEYLSRYGDRCKALTQSVLDYVDYFQKRNFSNLVLSVKCSDISDTIKVNRLLAASTDCPLHIGVTEAGVKEVGILKNSIGIGSLLLDGIGNTIRVSLTDDPIEEVRVAKQILSVCGLSEGLHFVSCPTCGRCQVDLINIAKDIYSKIKDINTNMTVAVMGCSVNGPGEASSADIGIAFGGEEYATLFKKGKPIGKLSVQGVADSFSKIVKEISNVVGKN